MLDLCDRADAALGKIATAMEDGDVAIKLAKFAVLLTTCSREQLVPTLWAAVATMLHRQLLTPTPTPRQHRR